MFSSKKNSLLLNSFYSLQTDLTLLRETAKAFHMHPRLKKGSRYSISEEGLAKHRIVRKVISAESRRNRFLPTLSNPFFAHVQKLFLISFLNFRLLIFLDGFFQR